MFVRRRDGHGSATRSGTELDYVGALSAERRGVRPPRLG